MGQLFCANTVSPNCVGLWVYQMKLINVCLFFRIFYSGTNLQKEPKFIVFLIQLLTLFKFCHVCKYDNPLVEVQQHGTMAEVICTCANPKCGTIQKWFSQPYMKGTKIPAGNFLLSFGILVAGTSATKVLRVFRHMGLACISLSTFFKHQRVSKP